MRRGRGPNAHTQRTHTRTERLTDHTQRMTNAELIERQQKLQQAAEHIRSVQARYAVQKTLRNVEQSLKTYREMLQELASDHDVDLGEGVPDDAPDDFVDDLEELLDMEQDEPETHTMPLDVLETEDDKGSDIPLQVLAGLDFMIEE